MVGVVAPHWGAWIEIHKSSFRRDFRAVAPHWGAWIEMDMVDMLDALESGVAPHWGAWIEMLTLWKPRRPASLSHPTGVRGLKCVGEVWHALLQVAPHWGAWIEIPKTPPRPPPKTRRTPLGCVD